MSFNPRRQANPCPFKANPVYITSSRTAGAEREILSQKQNKNKAKAPKTKSQKSKEEKIQGNKVLVLQEDACE